jgi:hypothetical protein
MTMDDEKTSNGKRMGRPPVEEPRKTRGVRMTEREWATFQALGGVDWLRDKLGAVRLTPEQKKAFDRFSENL